MNWNILEISVLSGLTFCFIIRMLFYWAVLAKPYYYMQYIASERLHNPTAHPPVSVIVYLKNSKYDLFQLFSNILEQDYPEFEVIVVTDGISDEDEEKLKRLKNQYANLYSTHVPDDTKNVSRKKLALTLGIKAAKYDKLLFTESDSRLRTTEWIFSLARHFSAKKTVVLGFSALENNKENLSHRFMEYDYFFSNLQMISCALLNQPYAGNGRNMAYSKEHFIEQRGFVKHRILQQGEDDLFINDIATGENTAVELSAQSVTLSEINDSREWEQQKTDRMVTQRFYKRGPVAFWRLETYTRIGFFAALIACFISGFPYTSEPDLLLPGIALACFIVIFSSQLFIINKILKYLQLENFYLTILLFDIFQPFVNLYFYIYRLLKGKKSYTNCYEK
jgi:glycosyltransferase involved in cell wall biosynthesis